MRLEDYLRGVVPSESPAVWPAAALQAQAIAARTYAITTNVGGNGFTQYPDTRSQMYRGVVAEKPTSDDAVKATKGQIVTYAGKPVVTYFFSTSGGQTENVENAFRGAKPQPWLKSVDDPFDDVSPKHRWGPIKLTMASVAKKLKGLVKGSFKGITVTKRGKSPRIVDAEVVGSDGRTAVTGSELRQRLGLFDTWAFFTEISSGEEPAPLPPTPSGDSDTADPSGGTRAPKASRTAALASIGGAITPGRAGASLLVERREGGRWVRDHVTTVRARRALPRVGHPARRLPRGLRAHGRTERPGALRGARRFRPARPARPRAGCRAGRSARRSASTSDAARRRGRMPCGRARPAGPARS